MNKEDYAKINFDMKKYIDGKGWDIPDKSISPLMIIRVRRGSDDSKMLGRMFYEFKDGDRVEFNKAIKTLSKEDLDQKMPYLITSIYIDKFIMVDLLGDRWSLKIDKNNSQLKIGDVITVDKTMVIASVTRDSQITAYDNIGNIKYPAKIRLQEISIVHKPRRIPMIETRMCKATIGRAMRDIPLWSKADLMISLRIDGKAKIALMQPTNISWHIKTDIPMIVSQIEISRGDDGHPYYQHNDGKTLQYQLTRRAILFMGKWIYIQCKDTTRESLSLIDRVIE